MNWQLVIAPMLLVPIAALTVAGYVKWTLHAWKVRTNRSIIDEIGTGRDHWIIWLGLHSLVLAIIGINLLRAALEGES